MKKGRRKLAYAAKLDRTFYFSNRQDFIFDDVFFENAKFIILNIIEKLFKFREAKISFK